MAEPKRIPEGMQVFSMVSGQARIEDEADFVIIGSGAGGATAARVLTDAGHSVILVEEGPYVPVKERGYDVWTGFRSSWRDCGFQVAEGRLFLPIIQGMGVGGTTTMNGAICHRMKPELHAEWVRDHKLPENLSFEEFSRIYDRVDQELQIAPAPEEVLGRHNTLLRDGLQAIGFSHNPIRRNVVGCEGSSRCIQGCPTAAKQSMDQTYLPFSLRKGARLYAECRVSKIVRVNGRAGLVEARFVSSPDRLKGPKATFRARRAVLLAASAIQTPLLLAASGIGKESGLVGQRFQCHPGISLLGEFEEPVRMWESVTQGYESTHLWTDRLKFETVSIPLDNAAARFDGYGRKLMENVERVGHLACWGVHVRSEAHGRVYRDFTGRTRIKYDMTDGDVVRLKRGLKLMAKMLFAAGAKSVSPGVHGLPKRMDHPDQMEALDQLDNSPNRYHGIASHMFGTAVMGADRKHSVVGFDGQVHEMPGLYVLDSSAFPTNLGVNPQNSIIAWSWLCSEKLA